LRGERREEMKIRSYISGSVKVIVPGSDVGREDFRDLRDEFRFLRLFSEVLFDLSEVQYAGSSIINLLVHIKNRFPEDYQKIKIINPKPMLFELFRITRIAESYAVFREEEALSPVL
jgi:anti-anti-sigma regulatory factor